MGLAAPLGLAWAARTGALERLPARLEDWIDGRPWRAAVAIGWPLAPPALLFAPLFPVSVWTFVVPALVIGLEFGVLWAVMSWLVRRESDEAGTSDPPAGLDRR